MTASPAAETPTRARPAAARRARPGRALRVVHVLPYYAPAFVYGGPVLATHALARAQIAAEAEIRVVATDRNGESRLAPPCEPGRDAPPIAHGHDAAPDGVPTRYCRARRSRFASVDAFAYAPSMAAALREAAAWADLLHLHGLYAYPTLAGAAAARAAGAPYVMSPRGMLDPYAIANKGAGRKRAYLRLVEGRNLRGAALLHFTTAAERDLACASLPALSRAPHLIAPNPATASASAGPAPPPERFWPALEGRSFALFLGRLDPKKGLEPTIDALARLEPDGSARRPILVAAGEGPAAYVAALRDRARAAGLEDAVLFPGFVSGAAKRALLAGCAFFVLASHSENFGNAVAEAMAAGAPVLVSDRVNLAPEVRRLRAGLVAPAQPAALAAAMSALWRLPEARRAEMGAAGAAWTRSALDPSAVARRMLAGYEAALARGASAEETGR